MEAAMRNQRDVMKRSQGPSGGERIETVWGIGYRFARGKDS